MSDRKVCNHEANELVKLINKHRVADAFWKYWWEKDVACGADGVCPLCIVEELAAVKAELAGAEALHRDAVRTIHELARERDALRADAERALAAWDSTVLETARDGMMQERMECLRSAIDAARKEGE